MNPADQQGFAGANAAGTSNRARSVRSRTLAILAIALWVMLLMVGLAWGAIRQLLGSLSCEPFEGSSTYGSFAWSVFPPGPTCTFTMDVHGFNEVRGPTPVMSIWLVVLMAGGLLCVVLLRRARRLRQSLLLNATVR